MPASWPQHWAYLAVFLAAAVEGEVVFVAAGVLVTMGRLSGLGVFVAAALGGAAGDQFFFYALRGRLQVWLNRYPWLACRREQLTKRVQRNATSLILACRFLPGLRVAIPAACAYAGVPAMQFTSCNFIGSLGWAGFILFWVTYLGPVSLAQLGLDAWWTPFLPAALIVGFSYWLSRSCKSLVAD
jgi:membrane protein DedA with SNARE-associated domain